MFVLVRDYQHRWIVQRSLNVLVRRASLHATAPVVSPWMRGAFDGLLTILSPREIILWYISQFHAYSRDHHHPLHL